MQELLPTTHLSAGWAGTATALDLTLGQGHGEQAARRSRGEVEEGPVGMAVHTASASASVACNDCRNDSVAGKHKSSRS